VEVAVWEGVMVSGQELGRMIDTGCGGEGGVPGEGSLVAFNWALVGIMKEERKWWSGS
jgi:hypothetical protein